MLGYVGGGGGEGYWKGGKMWSSMGKGGNDTGRGEGYVVIVYGKKTVLLISIRLISKQPQTKGGLIIMAMIDMIVICVKDLYSCIHDEDGINDDEDDDNGDDDDDDIIIIIITIIIIIIIII